MVIVEMYDAYLPILWRNPFGITPCDVNLLTCIRHFVRYVRENTILRAIPRNSIQSAMRMASRDFELENLPPTHLRTKETNMALWRKTLSFLCAYMRSLTFSMEHFEINSYVLFVLIIIPKSGYINTYCNRFQLKRE